MYVNTKHSNFSFDSLFLLLKTNFPQFTSLHPLLHLQSTTIDFIHSKVGIRIVFDFEQRFEYIRNALRKLYDDLGEKNTSLKMDNASKLTNRRHLFFCNSYEYSLNS